MPHRVGGAHAEVVDVVGKELTGGGQEQGEAAGEDQAAGNGEKQRTAVAQDGLEEARPFVLHGVDTATRLTGRAAVSVRA